MKTIVIMQLVAIKIAVKEESSIRDVKDAIDSVRENMDYSFTYEGEDAQIVGTKLRDLPTS